MVKLYNDKRVMAVLIIAVFGGVLLMLGSNDIVQSNKADTNVYSLSENNLEERLSDILSSVKGAGNVKVMITYETGSEKIIAYNTDDENDNEKFSSRKNSQAVMNNDGPVVLKEIYPKITGVLIVAQGGGNTEVKNNLINASSALLGIDVNKIEVLVMKKEA